MITFIKNNYKTLIIMICLLATLSYLWITNKSQPVPPLSSSQSTLVPTTETHPKVTQESTLKVTQKTSEDSPDLVVDTVYVAEINKKHVEVPVKTVETSNPNMGTTTTLKQEIDITELVKPLMPKWELGVGIGKHNGDTYIPLSIQRNYKADKAVSVEIHLDAKDPSKVNGGEVMHKWLF